MKRLITILALVILTISLAGCVVIEGHHYHGPRPYAVIVAPPRYAPVPPPPHYPYGHHHRGWHGHR
jgi:hypothetical protein